VNGNLTQVVQDAQRLATAVFDVYRTTAKEYERAIGPIVSPEQQKVVLDVALACVGIANKEQRVEKFREDRRNGDGNNHQSPKPKVIPETPTTPAKTVEQPERKEGATLADQPKPAPTPPKPPEDEEPMPLGKPERKPRDERDRPTEQLIQELNIRTPKQAGFLRYKKEISECEKLHYSHPHWRAGFRAWAIGR
jgi:hypothetical protein